MRLRLQLISAAATTAIALILAAVILAEPARQTTALTAYRQRAASQAVEHYVQQCVNCHGLAGEGIDVAPALSADSIRGKDPVLLFRSIARGHRGTEMTAFGIDEGGNLSNPQIDSLVVLIKEGVWETVAARSAALNIAATWSPTPPPASTPGAALANLPTPAGGAAPIALQLPAEADPAYVQFAIDTYGAKCSECHGQQGEGNPPDVADLSSTRVTRMSNENLLKLINFGVENTEMKPFRAQLTEEEKQALLYLIRHVELIR